MQKRTTPNVRMLPPDDLIDFPVSDLFRDHYAAQGLTYTSGRRPGRGSAEFKSAQYEASVWKSKAMRSQQEADEWRSRSRELETQVVTLQQQLRRQQSFTKNEVHQAVGFEPVVIGE